MGINSALISKKAYKITLKIMRFFFRSVLNDCGTFVEFRWYSNLKFLRYLQTCLQCDDFLKIILFHHIFDDKFTKE